jgi:hypothetical protein
MYSFCFQIIFKGCSSSFVGASIILEPAKQRNRTSTTLHRMVDKTLGLRTQMPVLHENGDVGLWREGRWLQVEQASPVEQHSK